ncbi:MAG: T9SS type A sorting domain-containing protein [Crocinitomicaceae bacterium]|nr:T9SS type A sorting domain-containing protein [Crocinitomicaceae bacterium]
MLNQITSNFVNISTLASGTYIIKLYAGDQVFVSKLVRT